MKTVQLGNTNLAVSNVALGIMRMNGLSAKQAAEVLTTAKEAGINYIDSADIYGMGGSEETFAEGMKEAGFTRDDFYIQSKGGIVIDQDRSHDDIVLGKRYDFSKQHLLDAVDGILKRMKIDYLDAFCFIGQIHCWKLTKLRLLLMNSKLVVRFGTLGFRTLIHNKLNSFKVGSTNA